MAVILGVVCTMSMRAHAGDDLEALSRKAVFAGAHSCQRTSRGDFSQGNFSVEVTVTVHGEGGNGCRLHRAGQRRCRPPQL